MMNRRIGSIILIFALICSALVGCGSNNNSNNSESNYGDAVSNTNDGDYDMNEASNDSEDSKPSEPAMKENLMETEALVTSSETTQEAVKNTQDEGPDEESTSGETYSEIIENQYIRTSEENTSTFSIDVDTASYSNLRDLLQSRIAPNKDAIRIEEMINYFSYDYPSPKDGAPFSITTKTTQTPWNNETVVTMIGIQGKRIDDGQLPPSNIVMLIDVSGSMQAANKLPLLKKSFNELVANLTEKDRVSLVVYAGAAGVVLEGAEGSDFDDIMDALNNLESGGSTAGGQGIELAYSIAEKHFIEGGNNRVVLASDGDFNVGLSSVGELEKLIEKQREKNIYLSVVGFGRGNTRDDVMETLADKGNGNYSYIDTYDEAKKVFGDEFAGTMFTIAKDVKVQVEFNSDVVDSYRLIGYENRVMDNEDFYDDKKDAGELGVGHEVTALYELSLKENVDVTSDNLYEVKLRYKEPNSDQSTGLDVASTGFNYVENVKEDADFNWALTVAEFGMILRDSNYKANANMAHILEAAEDSIQSRDDDLKEEFISLVKHYQAMIEDGIVSPISNGN